MELDAKQKVLLAIYTEYQKDIPDMKNTIKPEVIGLSKKVFKIAVIKLLNEGLICDVVTLPSDDEITIFMEDTKMTRYGIEYVEQKLGIENNLTGLEKVKKLAESSAKWGWEQFKDLTAKVLAEFASKKIGG